MRTRPFQTIEDELGMKPATLTHGPFSPSTRMRYMVPSPVTLVQGGRKMTG